MSLIFHNYSVCQAGLYFFVTHYHFVIVTDWKNRKMLLYVITEPLHVSPMCFHQPSSVRGSLTANYEACLCVFACVCAQAPCCFAVYTEWVLRSEPCENPTLAHLGTISCKCVHSLGGKCGNNVVLKQQVSVKQNRCILFFCHSLISRIASWPDSWPLAEAVLLRSSFLSVSIIPLW